MDLISMVLWSTQTRYWYTLLPAVMANLELYPGFAVRLYASQDALSHPASDLLNKLGDALPGRFQTYVISSPYTDQEPSTWRMRPIWDPNVSRFLCRDIDSVPCAAEIQAVRIWLRTPYAVHSVRSYHLHITLLMAGLCGFSNTALGGMRQAVPSFEEYINLYRQHSEHKDFRWGCDQELLRLTFGGATPMILDSPIGDCPHHAAPIPSTKKEDVYAEKLNDLPSEMLALCNEITAIPWGEFEGFAGRPQGDFRPYLQRMLDMPLETSRAVSKMLDENPAIKTFYQV